MRIPISSERVRLALLTALTLTISCTLPDRTTGPKEPKTEVYEIAREKRGLTMHCDSAKISLPAKISVILTLTSERGEPLTDLACRDFVLTEDSAAISPYESAFRVQVHPQPLHMSTLLLLDLSGSIVGASFDSLKIAAHSFTRSLFQKSARGNLSLALYWFDGAAQINKLADFTADTLHLHRTIGALNPGLSMDHSTNLNGALVRGLEIIKAEARKKKAGLISHGALAVFTDGKDSAARVTPQRAQSEVDSCGANISVYTLGLGSAADSTRLRAYGKDGFALADNIAQLERNFENTAARIQNRLRNRYLLEYCTPKREGRHTLKIVAAAPVNAALYGSVTISFPASGFTGGCMLEGACSN